MNHQLLDLLQFPNLATYPFIPSDLYYHVGVFVEAGFIRVASASEIEVGKTKKVTAGDVAILIVNVDGNFHAVDSLCSHYGGDLSEGRLEGSILTCPIHGAKFDVTTGRVVSPPTEPLDRSEIENLTSYPLKVEKQDIFIKILAGKRQN